VDINRLYFNHQISAMRATAMPTRLLRREAEQDASMIAEEIGCIQGALGALAAPGWERLGRAGRVVVDSPRPVPSYSGASPIVAATASGHVGSPLTPLRLAEQSENPDLGRSDGWRTQPSPVPLERWENEGGSQLAESYPESLGITRQLTETYRVGGYAYTNLADATAQARRMQKQESGR